MSSTGFAKFHHFAIGNLYEGIFGILQNFETTYFGKNITLLGKLSVL